MTVSLIDDGDISFKGEGFSAKILVEPEGGIPPFSCVIEAQDGLVGFGQLDALLDAYPSLNEIAIIRCNNLVGFSARRGWRKVMLELCPKVTGAFLPEGLYELTAWQCDSLDTVHMRVAPQLLYTFACKGLTGNGAPDGIRIWVNEDGPAFEGRGFPHSLVRLVVRRCPLFKGEGLVFDLSGLYATVDECEVFNKGLLAGARLARVDDEKVADRFYGENGVRCVA